MRPAEGQNLHGGSAGGGDFDWDDVIADICLSTGWTWDYVEDFVTLPRYEALQRQWADHPPLHKVVASFAGVKPKGKKKKGKKTYGNLADLARMFSNGMIR